MMVSGCSLKLQNEFVGLIKKRCHGVKLLCNKADVIGNGTEIIWDIYTIK